MRSYVNSALIDIRIQCSRYNLKFYLTITISHPQNILLKLESLTCVMICICIRIGLHTIVRSHTIDCDPPLGTRPNALGNTKHESGCKRLKPFRDFKAPFIQHDVPALDTVIGLSDNSVQSCYIFCVESMRLDPKQDMPQRGILAVLLADSNDDEFAGCLEF
eukprot:647386-Rhodomonas_salina.1